jgi:hypothetical protein
LAPSHAPTSENAAYEYFIDATSANRVSRKFNSYGIAPTYGNREALEASMEQT